MWKLLLLSVLFLAGCGRTEKFLNVQYRDHSMNMPLPVNAVTIRRDFNKYDYFRLGERYYCLGVYSQPNGTPQVFVFEVDKDVALGQVNK